MKSTIFLTSFSGKYKVLAMTDEPFKLTSEAAKKLSRLGASKGGEARASKLTPERRQEIARAAVEARWVKAGKAPIPVATHDGEITIGEVKIECAVLSDGQRVLSQRGVGRALGRRHGGADFRRGGELPIYLGATNLKQFIPEDLAVVVSKPLVYRLGAYIGHGIPASVLPKVCDVWLKARDAGVLKANQLAIAAKADILVRGLAHTGIIALVDEATGYQDVRAKDALAKILEAFIAKELRKWISTFPVDYYKELFRLRGWKFPDLPADQRKRPVLVGKITNDLVYDRLAPGVRQELNRLTPRDEKGRLKHKLFQRLTEDVGHPKLREHLASVTSLMKASDSWMQFTYLLNRALPRYGDTPYLPFEG
ncbi:MAG: P63C domain-containing protein [Terracidiphilus sp.]